MTNKYVLYIILFFSIVFIMKAIIVFRQKKLIEEFLEENPDAVIVYLRSTHYIVASSVVSVISVNGYLPMTFLFKNGFYTRPGMNEIVVRFDSERAGVFYKSVSESVDEVVLEVYLEQGREYEIYFDKKEYEFKIRELY